MRTLQGISFILFLLSMGVWNLITRALPTVSGVPLDDTQVWPQMSLTFYLGLTLPIVTLLTLAFSSWLAQPTPGRAKPIHFLLWITRLLPVVAVVALIAQQLFLPGDPYGPSHRLLPGVFQGIVLTLSAFVLLPLAFLNWTTMQRLAHWLHSASTWAETQNQSKSLQNRWRKVKTLLIACLVPLLAVGLVLSPVLMFEGPEPMSIQTPAQQLMVHQQHFLTLLVAAACLCYAAGLWLIRRTATDVTHTLDPQRSRISQAMQRSANQTGSS